MRGIIMKKIKVLVADDNESLLTSLQIQLDARGFEVLTCGNADLAVAYAEKHAPDVIVADIWMDNEHRLVLSPLGNGLGILERLKKIPAARGIPVIYITGDNSSQLDLRAEQMGAYGLIHKPVNIPGLAKLIEL